MLKKIIAVAILASVISNSESAAQTSKEAAVAGAVEALRTAMIAADSVALSQLTSDKLSYGHSSGRVEGKASFIQSLTSGQSDFVSIDISEQTVAVSDKTAIVRHRLAAETMDGGKPGSVKLAILMVWQKEKAQWRLLARQAVKL